MRIRSRGFVQASTWDQSAKLKSANLWEKIARIANPPNSTPTIISCHTIFQDKGLRSRTKIGESDIRVLVRWLGDCRNTQRRKCHVLTDPKWRPCEYHPHTWQISIKSKVSATIIISRCSYENLVWLEVDGIIRRDSEKEREKERERERKRVREGM